MKLFQTSDENDRLLKYRCYKNKFGILVIALAVAVTQKKMFSEDGFIELYPHSDVGLDA